MKAGANKLDQVKIRRMMAEGKGAEGISVVLGIEIGVVRNFMRYFKQNGVEAPAGGGGGTAAVQGAIPAIGVGSQVTPDEGGAPSNQETPAT